MVVFHLLNKLFLLSLAITLIARQPCLSIEVNGVDSHLSEYSQYSVTHHDNIDDEPHSHKHKHSEDGEEHEHNHEHSKVTQSEIKLLNQSIEVIAKVIIIESDQGFIEKNLISNPHPSRIYRPPISA